METIQKNSVLLILVSVLFLFSCTDNAEFNQYKSLENSSWQANKKINFEFDVTDTISPKNVFINLRNTNQYKFNNLYIITELSFPNKTIIIDTLQYRMSDNFGNFLGNGLGDIKDNKLFYKQNKIFPIAGTYQLNIRHAMRKNGEVKPIKNLEGVSDIGVSIEKIKK